MYDFWDYFWGWFIIAIWSIPLLAIVVVKIGFLVASFIIATSYKPRAQDDLLVRVRSYDYDEDR